MDVQIEFSAQSSSSKEKSLYELLKSICATVLCSHAGHFGFWPGYLLFSFFLGLNSRFFNQTKE